MEIEVHQLGMHQSYMFAMQHSRAIPAKRTNTPKHKVKSLVEKEDSTQTVQEERQKQERNKPEKNQEQMNDKNETADKCNKIDGQEQEQLKHGGK